MKTKVLTGILLLAAGLFVSSCSDDDDYAIHTDKIVSSVTTGNAEVTSVSATVIGSIKELAGQSSAAYSVGICYSTNQDPKLGKTEVGKLSEDGSFSVTVSGLTKGITYYYCTFVTLQNRVTYYGDV